MTFLTTNFDPLLPLTPKSPNFCITDIFLLQTHCSRHHRRTGATHLFLYHLSTGSCLPKTTLEPKLAGGLGKGSIPKNFGTPYLFLQLLKVAISNLVYNFGLGSSIPRNK